MRTFLTASATALAFVASAGIASAATFDFGQLAIDEGEGSFNDVQGGSWTVDGITITSIIGGTHDGVNNDSVVVIEDAAYLDGPIGSKPAGLGACTGGYESDGDCLWNDDDNVGPSGGLSGGQVEGVYEFLILSFDVEVTMSDITFRDDDHNMVSSGIVLYGIDGAGGPEDVSPWDLSNPPSGEFSTTWLFASAEPTIDFYIESLTATQVPVPAAGFLLLGGLGGLAAMKRRKKA